MDAKITMMPAPTTDLSSFIPITHIFCAFLYKILVILYIIIVEIL